jgi:hypothetical protein
MYNPFDKRIDELSLEDIKALRERQVKEGLYIEYKSAFTASLKIAHSIASFANTYGGWYFVGIESDQTNLPTNFPGFSMVDQPKPIEHLRNIIKDNVDPFPIYYAKLIEVESGKAILVVEIPESDETPHITKDGRIYRRNAEGSDPIPETNRYILDRLYEKSTNLEREIERFCCRDVMLSKAEENSSWIEIYIMPYPLNRMHIENFFEKVFIDSLKQKMNDPTRVELSKGSYFSSSIPFNSVGASFGSVVLRQINPESLPFLGLTFELFRNGNAKIIIPFEFIPYDSESDSLVWKKLISSLEEEDISLFRIIDGFKALSVFVVLLQKYIDFLKSQNWQDKVLIAYRLENTWRTILFFDSSTLINHINEYGVPICQRKNAWVPSRLQKTNMIEDVPENGIFQLSQFMMISSHFGTFPHEGPGFIKEWIENLSKVATEQKDENKNQV